MLKLLIGTDWVANRNAIMKMISDDVAAEQGNRVLIVPELISHDTERRLCQAAGDTTSRFAEVLSFTRLVKRVSEWTGVGVQPCMDNGGRVIAMAATTRLLHSKLKAYASLENRPEFLVGLVDAVDEFKRCCITAADLMKASKASEGSFAQKLEELSLILETYDSLCTRGKRDPRDQMAWLLEELEASDYAKEHVFYIDGFPDFTRQNLAIIRHLVAHSRQVVIGMNCDSPGSKKLAFEKAGDTASQILRMANDLGVAVEIKVIPEREDRLSYLRGHLYQGTIEANILDDPALRVYRTDSVYQECLGAVQRVRTLVESGCRYRDISIVCGDLPSYQSTANMLFQRCKIPAYQSGKDEILDKSVICTVLAAIDVVVGGFEQRDVLRYLRSMLSPLSPEQCDLVENYAILWNISGSAWLKTWERHPFGLAEQWDQAAEAYLLRINEMRRTTLEPLVRLGENFGAATSLKQQVLAIYRFLEEICLAERLSALADQMDQEGDNRNAQILNQLWEILLSGLEQMHDVLGETVWDGDAFARVLKLLLSQYDVGTIPPVLDAVWVGSVDALRCQQVKHLIVLGALEGNLPSYGGSSGVLTDVERTELRQLGVPLTGGAMEGLQAKFAEIYGVFCGAEESVTVSCPSGQPSFVFRRLGEMSKETSLDTRFTIAQTDVMEASAYLARFSESSVADKLGVSLEYNKIERHKEHTLGMLSKESVHAIYGNRLNLSASQIDRQAECRLSYFLRYGIRAKERKPLTVDPAEFGTYVHAVLEKTVKRIMDLGGFSVVDMDTALSIADGYSEEYAKERFSQLDSSRLAYLFRRNTQELAMVVRELWQEMRESAFVPVAFELVFGKNGQMDAINIPANSVQANLMGVVDRVDVWQSETQNFYRVVDYKTGRKDFDYCDVFNGIGLQMLLYLFALEDGGTDVTGDNAVGAGVQYFPARVPFVGSDGLLTDEEATRLREKAWKRKGLLLNDEQSLYAMEPLDQPIRLCYSRKKDGTLSGDLADRQQFKLLKAYVFSLLGNLVDEIASGVVEPNPYTRGTSHSACMYCPYSSICHPEQVTGRRDYKTMTSQRFWEEIEKEMSKRG